MTPTTPVRDNFNRADSANLGANWTSLTAAQIGISSNQADGVSGNCLSYYNVEEYGAAQESYVTIAVKPATGETAAVYVRMKDVASILTLDCYLAGLIPQAGTDLVRVQRVDNAVATTLGSDISQEFNAGDKLMLRAIGSTLSIWRYDAGTGVWTQIGTRTDSTYLAGGRIGMIIQNTTTRLDDFGGGEVDWYQLSPDALVQQQRRSALLRM